MDLNLLCFILLVLTGCVRSSPNHHHHIEYCVLGAGPAGLQMGYFLSKAQRHYIILERNQGPGSFFNRYPRHRKLISINKIYTGRQNREFNLRHDWNSLLSHEPDLLFKRVSGEFYPPADAFPRYLAMFATELSLRVRYGVDVGRIRAVQSGSGRSYVLTDQNASDYSCSVLLVATGLWVPQTVDFVGSDLVEGYESISTNPDDYRDQAVLILGKGNSAFETAQSILGRASRVHMLSSSAVRLAWQTHYVGDLRAVNNELLDTYQLKSLDGLVEARLEKIVIAKRKEQNHRSCGRKKTERNGKLYLTLTKYVQNGSVVSGEELAGHHIDNFPTRKPYDRVIRCLGFRFNFSVFDGSARLPPSENAKGRLPAVTAWYEGEDAPGLFVLGTASHSRDYRSSAGGFVHGFRYTARAVHRVLEQRYHGNRWPSITLLTTQLLSWILKRVGEASGPYQMFEVLGDVILLRGSHCDYVEEFPIQALPQFSSLSGHEVSSHGLLVLVMQYGKKKIDYLGRSRAETDWTKAWRSNFLHPVLYFYDRLPTDKEMTLRPHSWPLPRPRALHHMIEDFLTEWDGPVSHVQPLRRFLEHCVQTDLRSFYADSCFRLSLTHRKPPLFCRQRYLQQQGVARRHRQPQHAHAAGLIAAERQAGPAQSDPAFPSFLAQAEASVSSGLKLDL
ncbi:FAD-dependent oxidoreductase domain-containing protein 2 [Betta splendens]|uniref:FAD-dependent oxidoreductase domain-containing protein 2 n=1 Tax=Betta splendens TaxID=158456 RepID=A0A6P7N4Q7_BETSP|nr:FAD-dependent oxidoreductase domain-containing protein 2 [Betta splendens]XP_029014407.1 FAD-dependent oxidoreductase domain-containing protein 2 [Betta splendens]